MLLFIVHRLLVIGYWLLFLVHCLLNFLQKYEEKMNFGTMFAEK